MSFLLYYKHIIISFVHYKFNGTFIYVKLNKDSTIVVFSRFCINFPQSLYNYDSYKNEF